ncbi:MAG: LPS export ABC transporter permease LptF [Desulfobacteraceae bacterium]|jgi:lipopolysaccharide export system permease protein
MKVNSIINRYFFGELCQPFAINLFFFTFILLISKILEITNMVVNYNAGLSAVALLLLYSMPFFLAFVTPMSVMMAVLLTFLRMSADNEIIALKSSGVNPNRFLIPVALFCLLGWVMTMAITGFIMPWGNRAYIGLSTELAQSHIDAIIKERTFIDSFDGIMLYVNNIDMKNRSMKDVFIEDRRNKGISNVIVAPQGQITAEASSQTIRLRLYNGAINQVDIARQSAQAIAFGTYEMKLDLKKLIAKEKSGNRKSLDEMSISEIRKYLGKARKLKKMYYNNALMKLHQKFSLPVACFALGLLAIPLGMQSKTDKRAMGIVMGIPFFLLYYILLSVGWALGESGTLHPVVGMWAPNIILVAIGIYLYRRSMQDRPLQFGRLFQYAKFRQWIPRRQTAKPSQRGRR